MDDSEKKRQYLSLVLPPWCEDEERVARLLKPTPAQRREWLREASAALALKDELVVDGHTVGFWRQLAKESESVLTKDLKTFLAERRPRLKGVTARQLETWRGYFSLSRLKDMEEEFDVSSLEKLMRGFLEGLTGEEGGGDYVEQLASAIDLAASRGLAEPDPPETAGTFVKDLAALAGESRLCQPPYAEKEDLIVLPDQLFLKISGTPDTLVCYPLPREGRIVLELHTRPYENYQQALWEERRLLECYLGCMLKKEEEAGGLTMGVSLPWSFTPHQILMSLGAFYIFAQLLADCFDFVFDTALLDCPKSLAGSHDEAAEWPGSRKEYLVQIISRIKEFQESTVS